MQFNANADDTAQQQSGHDALNLQQDAFIKEILETNYQKMKHIIMLTLDQMELQLEDMPFGIRMICKILEILTKKKFPNITRNEQYNILVQFLFELYILPQFEFPQHMKDLELVDVIQEENLACFKKIMKIVVKRELAAKDINLMQYNPLVRELYPQVTEHFEHILNVNSATVEGLLEQGTPQAESSPSDYMKLFTATLSIANIKTLCILVEKSKDQILQIDKTIVQYAERILQLNEKYKFFDTQQLQRENETISSNRLNILLVDIRYPHYFQTNLMEIYEEPYRVNPQTSQHTS